MLLENKTAIIYAAGGAIGGAVARAFAREGARLFLTGRDVAKLEAIADEIVAGGGVAEPARVDALDERAVEEHLETAIKRAGGVDISFNAIGPGPAPDRTALAEMTADAFARPIAFYTSSNFITATAAARHMTGRGSGVIVTLTAVPGRLPANRLGGSAPAWAAVEALSRSLALEVGPRASGWSACARTRSPRPRSSRRTSPRPARPPGSPPPSSAPCSSRARCSSGSRRSPKSPTRPPSWPPTAPGP